MRGSPAARCARAPPALSVHSRPQIVRTNTATHKTIAENMALGTIWLWPWHRRFSIVYIEWLVEIKIRRWPLVEQGSHWSNPSGRTSQCVIDTVSRYRILLLPPRFVRDLPALLTLVTSRAARGWHAGATSSRSRATMFPYRLLIARRAPRRSPCAPVEPRPHQAARAPPLSAAPLCPRHPTRAQPRCAAALSQDE